MACMMMQNGDPQNPIYVVKGGLLAKSRKLFFSGEVIFGGQNPKNAKENFKNFYCPKSFVRSY